MSVLHGSEGAMQESEQGEVLSTTAAHHPPSLLPLCSVIPWAARCDLVIEQDMISAEKGGPCDLCCRSPAG